MTSTRATDEGITESDVHEKIVDALLERTCDGALLWRPCDEGYEVVLLDGVIRVSSDDVAFYNRHHYCVRRYLMDAYRDARLAALDVHIRESIA